MQAISDYEYGISAIDSGYGRPQLAAIHLVVEDGRAALIDTGNYAAVAHVLAALQAKGLGRESVDYVILTHIHLDHAGGAGALMAELPNAQLVVHPRGARHMIDPSRLLAGVAEVYGEEATRRMYGALVPVPAERVIEATHERLLALAGRELLFLDTPGHARHHLSVVDRRSGHAFTGDTFGLSYRELDRDGMQFIFPTTSPVHFEPRQLHASIGLIESFAPAAVYVTHYGQVRDVPRLAADMHRLIDAHVALALAERDAGQARHARLVAGLWQILFGEARRYGWTLPRERLREVFDTDIELNAQGLGVWLDGSGAA
jgi:glyoxylase-like metal-dependent hydrolase (beta-lactamase superfamily II)